MLRADVYRPDDDGRYPVILSYGPYAKALAFQEGYPNQSERMFSEHPDVAAGSSNRYQNRRSSTRRSGCRRGTCACAWTRAGPGAHPGMSTTLMREFAPHEAPLAGQLSPLLLGGGADRAAPERSAAAGSRIVLGDQSQRLAGVERWHVLRENVTLPVPSQLMSGRLVVATLRVIRS